MSSVSFNPSNRPSGDFPPPDLGPLDDAIKAAFAFEKDPTLDNANAALQALQTAGTNLPALAASTFLALVGAFGNNVFDQQGLGQTNQIQLLNSTYSLLKGLTLPANLISTRQNQMALIHAQLQHVELEIPPTPFAPLA